jgi:hypothetical protein
MGGQLPGTTRLAIGPHLCTSSDMNVVTACGVIGSAAMPSSASRRRKDGVAHDALTAWFGPPSY